MAVSNKPFAWSYSALDAYSQCALQLKETRITKRFSDRNKFNVSGDTDHKRFEDRIMHGKTLPTSLEGYESALQRIIAIPGQARAELEMCITRDWKPTGWFSKNAWARAKVDLSIVQPDKKSVIQFDWKFGRYKKDSRWLQLKINALLFDAMTKAHGVTMDTFTGVFIWVPEGFKAEPLTIRQEDISAVRSEVMEHVVEYQRAYDQDDFPPTKNGLCRQHCPVLSCRHNGRKGNQKEYLGL